MTQWVNGNEQLPQIGKRVLVCFEYNIPGKKNKANYIEFGYFNGVTWHIENYPLANVIYWMEVPKIPS